jgi:ABC-2 type transport system permease protein
VSAIYAIQAALRLRSEEEALRAELVLATSASRLRWMAGHLVVVGVGSAAVLAALGLAAGLTYAPPGAGLGAQLPRVLAAAMAYLPALWVLLGLTAALFGLLPRLVSVSWMVLVGCLLLELARELELVSQTVLDLSPFTHVPRLLLGQEAATPLVGSAAAALLLAAAGLLGFRHRDVSRV